jgi:hypothetical protein
MATSNNRKYPPGKKEACPRVSCGDESAFGAPEAECRAHCSGGKLDNALQAKCSLFSGVTNTHSMHSFNEKVLHSGSRGMRQTTAYPMTKAPACGYFVLEALIP